MRDNRRRSKPTDQIKVAKERIELLISRAEKVHGDRPELARRYFQLAKKIGMRYNVKIPRYMKRKFCKNCFTYISEGWRFKNGKATIKCKSCGKIMRYPYKPSKRI